MLLWYVFLLSVQILVKTVPIKQGHKLRIIWPITPGIHHYQEGPCRYLGHLIGHEGEGSLFYTLKKLGGFFISPQELKLFPNSDLITSIENFKFSIMEFSAFGF